MVYYITKKPKSIDNNSQIFRGDNGHGCTTDSELHLITDTVHYVYKFTAEQVGWYMRNMQTKIDYFLGNGASPTINLDNIVILNEEYWSEINYIPQNDEVATEQD